MKLVVEFLVGLSSYFVHKLLNHSCLCQQSCNLFVFGVVSGCYTLRSDGCAQSSCCGCNVDIAVFLKGSQHFDLGSEQVVEVQCSYQRFAFDQFSVFVALIVGFLHENPKFCPGHEDDFGCCNSARMLCEAAPTQRAEVGRCRGASAGSPAIPRASRMKD